MAAAFAAGGMVLRVTGDPAAADATLRVASVAYQLVRTARPLHATAVRVPVAPPPSHPADHPQGFPPVSPPVSPSGCVHCGRAGRAGGVVLAVEAYERLSPVGAVSAREVGVALAGLHATDPAVLPPPAGAERLRPQVRLAVSRARLGGVLADRHGPWFDGACVVAEALDDAVERCGSLGGPVRLVHTDASPDNLLSTATGPAWVDWEYAGAGPPALDVALAAGDRWRFAGPDAAAELLAGYWGAGGCARPEDVFVLSGVRDAVGAADVFPPRRGAAWRRLAGQRLGSLAEPGRATRWEALASLG
jgi:hypothetical protein